jgi:PAS domain S-box-containing protein
MVTIDDGGVIAANPRMCQMLDMSEGEVIERGRTGGIVVQDEKLKAALEERKATGKYQGELTFRRKDGSLFPVETSMCTFRSSNGNIVSGQLVRDITERKRTEESLQRSYTELESLVEHRTRQVKLQAEMLDLAHDAIIVRGEEGNILFWSEGAAATYGWAKNEVIGKIVQDVLQTTFPMEFEVIMDIVKRDGSWEGELIHTCKDGRAIVVLSRWALRKAVTGDHAEILEVNRDMTKQKEMQDALRKTDLYNRKLIETSLDPLVAIGPEDRITDVNVATEKATGYAREELIGTEFSDYFTNPGKAKAGYQVIFREGSVRDYELEIKHRNGSTTPILYNASVCRNELGEIVGVFAAARDITERKRVEEELTSKSIALEELNIALKVLIDRVRNETEKLEAKVSTNIRVGVLPYLEKLRRTRLDMGQSALIEIVERNLNDIASPFLKTITSSRFRLSPKEIEIISLIKEGKTTKEIANILSLGSRTIDSYRDNIRNKLGLSDRRTNLRTFLLSTKIE